MSRAVDDMLARADEFNERADRKLRDLSNTQAGRAAARRRQRRSGRPLRTRAIRAAAVLVAAFLALLLFYIIFGAIGIDGFLLLAGALALALGAALFWPTRPEPPPTVDTIRNAELAALPVRVENWLERRRGDLPAAARRQVDELTLRLEVLAAQLEKVGRDAPVVADARRLIGEELPRLVESYVEIPESYRSPGSDPERQLLEGLDTVSTQLQRLSDQLAKGDLDRLAIEGRFLETKYKDDAAGGGAPAN